MQYESETRVESAVVPGVGLWVRRMSFGRRLELTRRVQEAAKKLAFLAAGQTDQGSEAESALLAAEIDREYLRWGLARIEGLEIDGAPANPESLIEAGPEALVGEALRAVRREAGLNEDERKKLRVAFHFLLGSQTGWNCDECRRLGLEVRRRCGWLDKRERGEERVVWVSRRANGRGERVSTSECPVSMVSGESRAALEEWLAQRRIGGSADPREVPARTLDAWVTLDVEREAMEANSDGG